MDGFHYPMAQRIPKSLLDLRDMPSPSPGMALGWGPDGKPGNISVGGSATPRAQAMAAIGIWVGTTPPPTTATYADWLAGAPGYWAWVDTSTPATAPLLLTAPAASLLFSGAVPTMLVKGTTIVYAPAASILLQGGVPSLFVGGGLISLTAVAAGMPVTAAPPTLQIINNTVALTAPGASMLMAAGVPTSAVTGGGTSVSDDFNRASLGADWAAITGRSLPTLSGNSAQVPVGGGARWAASAFAADQYAEAYCSPMIGGIDPGTAKGVGPAVRISDSADSFYFAGFCLWNDGSGMWQGSEVALFKCVGGVVTQLGARFDSGDITNLTVRIKATGTTISVETAVAHAGPFTQRISVTDSSLTGGWAGVANLDIVVSALDNWYGGSN